MIKKIKSISELTDFVLDIKKTSVNNPLFFRGEKFECSKTALHPSIYRDKYIDNEDFIYRESQRFNNDEFSEDRTTFDRLSRIQHYSAPTRLIDVSEDLLSALYFAIAEKTKYLCEPSKKTNKRDKKNAVIYIFEIDISIIKYYDSDTVSVISNLAKMPLSGCYKSKEKILEDCLKYKNRVNEFNNQNSTKFLRHEIREEKPQFESIINPKHLTSIQFVLPKLTSNRIRLQKGAFLLFGLNPSNHKDSIKLLDETGNLIPSNNDVNHPIVKIHTAILINKKIAEMQKQLKILGVTKSFIYPEIDKVSQHLIETTRN